ncbi:unnamed protein product, partial [Ectocarpus fasciculatus]
AGVHIFRKRLAVAPGLLREHRRRHEPLVQPPRWPALLFLVSRIRNRREFRRSELPHEGREWVTPRLLVKKKSLWPRTSAFSHGVYFPPCFLSFDVGEIGTVVATFAGFVVFLPPRASSARLPE